MSLDASQPLAAVPIMNDAGFIHYLYSHYDC